MSYSPLRRQAKNAVSDSDASESGASPKFDDNNFWRAVSRWGIKLGRPVLLKLLELYFIFKAPTTPIRAKVIIVAALVYFVSPLDAITNMMGPLGFTDDIAVITVVYAQVKKHITDEIRTEAHLKLQSLLTKWGIAA